jgi:hypothetical protein
VVDPDGRVLSTTGSRAGTALARVDPRKAVGEARAKLSYIADMRPHAYGAPALT